MRRPPHLRKRAAVAGSANVRAERMTWATSLSLGVKATLRSWNVYLPLDSHLASPLLRSTVVLCHPWLACQHCPIVHIHSSQRNHHPLLRVPAVASSRRCSRRSIVCSVEVRYRGRCSPSLCVLLSVHQLRVMDALTLRDICSANASATCIDLTCLRSVCVCIYICFDVCACFYLYVCVCVCVLLCVWSCLYVGLFAGQTMDSLDSAGGLFNSSDSSADATEESELDQEMPLTSHALSPYPPVYLNHEAVPVLPMYASRIF
jgi:hypothetical protein